MAKKKHNMNNVPISKIEFLISEWIHNKKYRDILRMKLIDDETFETVAEVFDMSVPQIKTIVYASVAKMYEHIDD